MPDNYHVSYDSHYYSVPYTMLGQQVYVKARWNIIQVIDKNHKIIAEHKRNYGEHNLYSTSEEHMSPAHQNYHQFEQRNGNSYKSWAKKVGINTERVIEHILQSQPYEEQTYRSCMAVLQLGKANGYGKLEEICKDAVELNTMSYTSIKRLMNNSINTSINEQHENIRGKDTYK